MAQIRSIKRQGRENGWRQAELVTSRDGVHWKLPGTKRAYIPAGGAYLGKNVREALSVHGMVRSGDALWSYALLKAEGHVQGSTDDQVARIPQRLDGFTSLDPVGRCGAAVTKPITFSGLELNVRAPGSLRVGVLDEGGQEIEGFRLSECDPVRGDSIRHTATWGGNPVLGSLKGKLIRLKLELDDARLHALQFVD